MDRHAQQHGGALRVQKNQLELQEISQRGATWRRWQRFFTATAAVQLSNKIRAVISTFTTKCLMDRRRSVASLDRITLSLRFKQCFQGLMIQVPATVAAAVAVETVAVAMPAMAAAVAVEMVAMAAVVVATMVAVVVMAAVAVVATMAVVADEPASTFPSWNCQILILRD
jgi:hypothetical protein